MQWGFNVLRLQDQEAVSITQQEKRSPAEKRKQCHGASDDCIKPSHEAESSHKKIRVDDYFAKKASATVTSSTAVEKVDSDTGNDCPSVKALVNSL